MSYKLLAMEDLLHKKKFEFRFGLATLLTIFYLLFSTLAFSQDKESSEIHKTKSSATIGGIKYYLHTVEKGQTLFAIAKFYGRDVNDIVIENPDAIDGIKPGQVLRIPIEKKKASDLSSIDTSNSIIHKVEKGQTLYSISKQYGVSEDKLKVLNPELKEGLKIGQLLKIPSNKPKTEAAKSVKATPNATVKEAPISDVTFNKEPADKFSATSYKYPGHLKDIYNIAFFLPFHAEEANTIDLEKIIKGDVQLPNKTNVALSFYEGALLALDSLKKQKLNAKIFVYDIDDRDSMNIITILKKPELSSMDLMIGPLYGSSFIPIAKFAKEHSIAIVSPFTQINKILFDNPYVCKISPSTSLQIEQMARFVVDTFHTQNIILLNNSNPKEVSFFNSFKSAANNELIKSKFSTMDSMKTVSGLAGVQNVLSASKTNVIILLSNNQSYITDFISKLNVWSEKYKIVLFGLQNWMSFDNLDFEYLNKLSLHYPSNNFIDYNDTITKKFIKNYRDRFKTEPEIYAYQGFDITYHFTSLLYKNGSGFLNELTKNKFQGIETNYDFSQFPLDSGFENKFVYILKYQDYKLTKANK